MMPVLLLYVGAGLVFAVAYRFPDWGRRWFCKAERVATRLFPARWTAWVIIGAFLAASFLLLAPLKVPQPAAQDEFSYLLGADTFATGRLSNPTHPQWKHFESFHILQKPVYVSKYPPGQSLFLALGQFLWRPILGVWISTALAGAAIYWMLLGIFRRSWALVGTLLSLTNSQLWFWNWCYFGGSVALMGGALVIGGFWRNRKRASIGTSLFIGLGMGAMALSRPFEGAVLSVLVMGVCFYDSWKKRMGLGEVAGRIVSPILFALLPFLIFQAVYNARISGNPLLMPYFVYERTYNSTPLFLFQSERTPPPEYNNQAMRVWYQSDKNEYYTKQHTLAGYCRTLKMKAGWYKMSLWNYLLLLFLWPLARLWQTRPMVRLISFFLGVMAFVVFGLETYTQAHYTAPFTPFLVILLCLGLRHLRTWTFQGRRFGLLAERLLVIYICASSLAIFLTLQIVRGNCWQYQRAEMLQDLEHDGQKRLVIVHYGLKHNPANEWVYNRADIDRATIVWARDLGDAENQKLLDHFSDRQVTRINVDR